jgi:DNA-binding PadR family transcriptional regulator
MGVELTTLTALLLFLAEGKSGYDIRLLFQATPLGLFSDSPGAIYPALARLERGGLLRGEAQPSARRRRVFHRTEAGETALRAWLDAPVDPVVAARRPHELDLRYVLIATNLGIPAARRFLDSAADAYRRRIAELEAFRDSNSAIGGPSIDALDLGIRLFRTRLSWCGAIAGRRENEG